MQQDQQNAIVTFQDQSNLPYARYDDTTEHSAAVMQVVKLLNSEKEFNLTAACHFFEGALLEDSRAEYALVAIANTGSLVGDAVIRLIRIYEVVCSKPNLLNHLLRLKSPEPRVKSKIALTVGRLTHNLHWLSRQLADPDHRVRANIVESLWNVHVEGIEQILRQASNDHHHRVVANAACAYYKLGRIEAFELCRSLLSNTDTVARRAGLWAVRHIGDPRFLDYLHGHPVPPADDLESAAKQQTIAYLGDCLNLACFADMLTLQLLDVHYSGSGLRRLQFLCLPSDPSVPLLKADLTAVNFALEENGAAVDSYEYRWVPTPEPIHFHILAPEDLRFRREMMGPHASLESEETIVLTRFQPATAKEGALSLTQLLGRAVRTLEGLKGAKNLLLVLDRAYQFSFSPADVSRLHASHIQVHAVVNGHVPEEIKRRLSDLCTETGGTLVRTPAAHELEKQLHLIRAQHAGFVELAWKSSVQHPSSISVQCYGGFGFGEMII